MIKWYEESDAEVNRSIALLTGENPDKWYPYGGVKGKDYCKNPSDAWPIICANKISLNPDNQSDSPQWQARMSTRAVNGRRTASAAARGDDLLPDEPAG